LVPIVVPIPLIRLGLFTSAIQALVFATLAGAYIGEAVEEHHLFYSFQLFYVYKIKTNLKMIDTDFKKKVARKNEQFFYNNSKRIIYKDESNLPTCQLKVRIASPIKLRWLCTRKTSEGFTIGNINNAKTVNYKTQEPFPGGLFCEAIFGPLNRGICACKKTHWRSYPIIPKKLIRFQILRCLYCSSQTIYSIRKPISTFKIFQVNTKQCLKKLSCKCRRTKIHLFEFFQIIRICGSCITPTKTPIYGETLIDSHSSSKYNKKKDLFKSELIDWAYRPGLCDCGLTSTEVPWHTSIHCRCCFTDVYVSTKQFPRRRRIGFLPLSLPIAHLWYYRFRPFPLTRLTGFSRRIFPLILYCERTVAEELFLCFNKKTQLYFSSIIPANRSYTMPYSFTNRSIHLADFVPVSTIGDFNKKTITSTNTVSFLEKIQVHFFPWYCLYRNSVFFSIYPRKRKSGSK
jgi:hypothetical protein